MTKNEKQATDFMIEYINKYFEDKELKRRDKQAFLDTVHLFNKIKIHPNEIYGAELTEFMNRKMLIVFIYEDGGGFSLMDVPRHHKTYNIIHDLIWAFEQNEDYDMDELLIINKDIIVNSLEEIIKKQKINKKLSKKML